MSALDPALETLLEDEAAPVVSAGPVAPAHGLHFTWARWNYLLAYYRPQWPRLALLALVAVAQACAILGPLQFVPTAIDVAIPHHDFRLLLMLGAAMLLARVLTAALAVAARSLGASIAKRASAAARLDLLRRLYRLSRGFHGASDVGRIHTRITQLSERVDQATSTALSDAGPALLVIAALMVWLLHINVWLVMLGLPIAPISWIAAALARRRVRANVQRFQGAYERFGKGVLFVLSHMELTKTRGFEAGELGRQQQTIDELARASQRMSLSYALYSQVQSVVGGLGAVVLLIGGGVAIMQGVLTPGSLVAFFGAAVFLNTYASKVNSLAPDLIAAEEALGPMLDLSRATPLEPYGVGGTEVAFTGRISVRDASVGYNGRSVLRGVSLDIAPGDNLAIVGANGAGKTTLLNLILGFLKPDAGAVLAEGQAYDSVDMPALRRQIGVVPQKPGFFAGTVAENISYGWPGAGREEIEAAAARVGVDAFIRGLPQGYDTPIGDGGALVSGGEAQRIAIARALVGKPRLLILDEPTNHLDTAAVSSIMTRLTEGPDQVALLTVSHDPDVVRCARTVYRLEAGNLTRERGPEA